MNIIPWKKDRQETRGTEGSQAPLSLLRSEVDDIFEKFFRDPWSLSTWQGGKSNFANFSAFNPSIDVAESAKEVTVKVEVPGIEAKDLDISLSGNILTIQGEKSEESEKKEKDYYHSERRFGSFRRSIELPQSIDADSVSAEQKHGVLTISIKKTGNGNSRKISVCESKN